MILETMSSREKVMVSIAVGADDPASGWQHPSVNTDHTILQRQSAPGYLKDAVEQGYFVVSLVLNRSPYPDAPSVQVLSQEQNLFRVQVQARFPLQGTSADPAWNSLARLVDAVAQKGENGLLAVMNSITNNNYRALVDLVRRGKAPYSAYLHSYALLGNTVQTAYNRASKVMWMVNESCDFATLGDIYMVFHKSSPREPLASARAS
jgi:hypothetical protein